MSTSALLHSPDPLSSIQTVDIAQGTQAWVDWRIPKVTASDMPAILGLSPYKTPWQCWGEKVGLLNPPDLDKNPNVQRGKIREDVARQFAEKQLSDVLMPLCAEYTPWPTFAASLDGLTFDAKPVEIKAPCEKVYAEIQKNGILSKTYLMYEAQVHSQCIVCGATEGLLVFYLEGQPLLVFTVTLTPERHIEIMTAAKTFWDQVQSKTPPTVDPERDWFIPKTADERFRWEAASDSWSDIQMKLDELEEKIATLKEDKSLYQQELINIMGNYKHSDYSGVKGTVFHKRGSVDYPAFLQQRFPDQDFSAELEAFRKPGKSQSRFSFSNGKLVNEDFQYGDPVSEIFTDVEAGFF